jgi:hypothetical protein
VTSRWGPARCWPWAASRTKLPAQTTRTPPARTRCSVTSRPSRRWACSCTPARSREASACSAEAGRVLQSPRSPGAFADIGSPPFTDAEDNSIGGNLTITGLQSCRLGALRNSGRGSVLVAGNTMADPDAMEVLANKIHGSIACFNNSPAVQYGDSGSSPNQVKRHAFGECGFNVLKPNPAPTPTSPAGRWSRSPSRSDPSSQQPQRRRCQA